LVDAKGNPITVSDPNQADMCEIIRSILHLRVVNGKDPINLAKGLAKDFFTPDIINCPGPKG